MNQRDNGLIKNLVLQKIIQNINKTLKIYYIIYALKSNKRRFIVSCKPKNDKLIVFSILFLISYYLKLFINWQNL